MKNKLKITIYNKDYNLVSDETQEYTNVLAAKIDSGIRQLLMSAPCLSVQEASVLFALDCIDELTKTKQNMENIRSQIKGYVDDAVNAQEEADEAKKENRMLKEKIEKLELELHMRTAFVKKQNEESLNSNDTISEQIKEIAESPANGSNTAETVLEEEERHEMEKIPHQREKKPEPRIVNQVYSGNNNQNTRTYVGQVNYHPNGGNK